MHIGEAARRSGLAASAIRFYEDAGVLPEPERTTNGYRDYSSQDLELLRFVNRLRSLEFPLDDVRQVVDLWISGKAPCSVVRDSIQRETVAIGQRISELRRLQEELADFMESVGEAGSELPVRAAYGRGPRRDPRPLPLDAEGVVQFR